MALKTMNSPLYILEHTTSDGEMFHLHVGCQQCFIPVLFDVDHWSKRRGFLMGGKDHFNRCCFGKTQLYGKTISVSAFGSPPFIEVLTDPATQERTLGGIDVEILTQLAKKFLFRVKVIPEKSWGTYVDGQWDGTVGSVSNGSSQLGIGQMSMTYDRYQVVDFSVPNYLVEYGHLSHKPKELDPFKNIVKPFDPVVWALIVCTVVSAALAFAILYEGYNNLDIIPYYLNSIHHSTDFLLLPLSMLVQQNRMKWFDHFPKESAGSIMILVWSLGGLVLTLAYISNLRASLIAIEYEKPIDTVQDVLAREDDVWYVRGTSLVENLRESPVQEIRDLYELVIKRNTFYSYKSGLPIDVLNRVASTGRGSLFAPKASIIQVRESIERLFGGTFPFYFSKQLHVTVYAGIVVPKYCSFVEDINKAIYGLSEAGLINHFFFKNVAIRYLQSESSATIKTAEAPRQLEFITIASAVIFLGVMHSLAILVFLFERGSMTRNSRVGFEVQFKRKTYPTRPKIARA